MCLSATQMVDKFVIFSSACVYTAKTTIVAWGRHPPVVRQLTLLLETAAWVQAKFIERYLSTIFPEQIFFSFFKVFKF